MSMKPGVEVDEVTKSSIEDVGLEKAKAIPERSSPSKKWLWISIVALLLIAAAAITTGVVVSKNNKDSTRDKNLATGGDNGGGGGAKEEPIATDGEPTKIEFTQTKSAIDWICGEDTTLEECQEACEDVPECCAWDGECLDGADDWEGCVNYAKCHVVKGLEEAAPSNLGELCAARDLSECETVCQKVECCYQDELECDSPFYSLTCLDYAPCQNLRDNIRVPTAVDGLEELCSPLADADDRALCDAECKKADCCWSLELEGENSNCLESDFIPCLTYASCGLLKIPEANAVVPAAPDDLFNTTCAPDKIWEAGPDREACQAECDKAECCGNLNMTDGVDNCFLDDPFGCAAYAPCALLPLTGGDVTRAPEDLAETCSPENLADPEKEQTCEDVCGQARCCWDPDENCLGDGNFFTCLEYAPCAILIISGGDVPEPDTVALDDACSRDAYEQDPDMCKAFCKDGPAGCCFETENLEANCFFNNLDICPQWVHGGCFRIAFNSS